MNLFSILRKENKVKFQSFIYTVMVIFICYSHTINAQTCSLGNPVFVENFDSGNERLGPNLNQDPNTNVHPDFRPASLYNYVGGNGTIIQDDYSLLKTPIDAAPNGGADWNDDFADHTPDVDDGGLGYMYYCDASEDLKIFYAQKIDGLCNNIEYELSAWFAKTNAPSYFIDPDIKLIVGFTDASDTPVGAIVETNTGPVEGVGANRWQRFSLVFSVPAGTENIYFMLQNNVAGPRGNDLAIDDIEVRPCGPEITFTDNFTSNVIDTNFPICFGKLSDRNVSYTANIPPTFVMQWQESFSTGIWTDISGENSNTLNYTIPNNFPEEYAIRLKFAQNATNLNDSNCNFFSEEIKYFRFYMNNIPSDNLQFCDDNSDGSDTNGIIQNINLETYTSIILGNLNADENTVTYHVSQSDAYSGNMPLSSPHENITVPFMQNIFVRVENSITGCINSEEVFTIRINPVPIANMVDDIQVCDDATDGNNANGIVQNFDLESQTNIILGSQSSSDYNVTYHESQSDANSGSGALTSPYANSLSPNLQTIYVRIENNTTHCFNDGLNFNLIVNALPESNPVNPIERCDNLDDTDDTNGIIQDLDLESQTNTILGGQSSTNYIVTYHQSPSDATSGLGALTSPYENQSSPNQQTIYVRVENTVTGCVNDSESFDIIVKPLPQANPNSSIVQCDDDTNDGQAFFNLTLDSVKENINVNHLAQNLTFTYYENQIDAEAGIVGTEIPISESYQDAAGFTPETIWVRVENTLNCFKVVPLLLQVNPSSNALSNYNPNSLFQCDDGNDIRDGIATFNLNSIRDDISVTFFSTINVSVHFYENQIDAELEINEISNITNHQNTSSPNTQSIWVKIKSAISNDCLDIKELPNLLIVEHLPFANTITLEKQCDFDTNDNVLSYPFDVSQLENNILNGQNPNDVLITYFDNNGNTLLYDDGSPVTSPIQPVFNSENQTITIQVTNRSTQDIDGPCYDETTLDFIVDEQPVANPVSPIVVCDGESGDLDDDGIFEFDTSNFSSTILGSQSNMEVFYSFINENGDAITNSTTLPNPLASSSQSITVEVINPLNQNCTAIETIDLTVISLPEFNILPEDGTICTTSTPVAPVLLEAELTNDTEVFIYEWRWTNMDGTIVDGFLSNDESISASQPGIYYLTLTKTDGTGCERRKEILVDSAQEAILDINNIDISNPSHTHIVTIKDPTLLGPDVYEYALVDEDSNIVNYQDNTVFNNVKPGFYTLYVRDIDRICDPSLLDISVIGYQRFFTPNGDGINEFWNIKGIDNTQSNSTIRIYDRYGKLIKQISALSDGWDGTYNGQLMPMDDYWFKVNLESGSAFMGHFTLKR